MELNVKHSLLFSDQQIQLKVVFFMTFYDFYLEVFLFKLYELWIMCLKLYIMSIKSVF